HERLVLADDDGADAVEQNRAAAHRARRERRVDNRLAIDRRRLPAGVLESVHLAMQHGAAALHASIVSASDDAAAVDDDGTDRNAAFATSGMGLLDRCTHENVAAGLGHSAIW